MGKVSLAVLGVLVVLTFVSLIGWASYNVRLAPSGCTGLPNGSPCTLTSNSGTVIVAQAIAIGNGVCFDRICQPKSCPVGTFSCTKSAGTICCPGTKSGDKYKCKDAEGEPYCQPNKAECDTSNGWTFCDGATWTNICCAPGLNCGSSYGYGICTYKGKDGTCPSNAPNPCEDYCCTNEQTCITVKAPFPVNTYKLCSANSCPSGKELCKSTVGNDASGGPIYPNICCTNGKCEHGTSGRPYCSDGDPGL